MHHAPHAFSSTKGTAARIPTTTDPVVIRWMKLMSDISEQRALRIRDSLNILVGAAFPGEELSVNGFLSV